MTPARIGDGRDMLARGVISRTNSIAARLRVVPAQSCHDAAVRLLTAPIPSIEVPGYREGRHRLGDAIWGLDSVGMVMPEDCGRILVIGSHAAVFNDAGSAVTRLPALDARGIPAAAVDCMSARIGDCRSMWDTGIVSHVNASAKFARPGMSVQEAVAAMR